MSNEVRIPVRDEKIALYIEPQEEERYKGESNFRKVFRVLSYAVCIYLICVFSNVGSSRDEDIFALSNGVCREEPSIPFEGGSEFFVESPAGLVIKEKRQSGVYIPISSGETTIIEDPLSDGVYVKFDIKLSDETLQDTVWIDVVEDDSIYDITVNTAGTDIIDGACIQINLIVTLPSVNALPSLSVKLSNNNIHVESPFTFEDLSLSVANGGIDINKGVHTGATKLDVSNGDIDAIIETLKDDLSVSVSNGHVQIKVIDIEEKTEGIQIKSSIANGRNEIEVPASFESRFELKSFLGKKLVESSEPDKIHLGSSGWGSSTGYYGNHEDTNNKIVLSSANGNLLLTYE